MSYKDKSNEAAFDRDAKRDELAGHFRQGAMPSERDFRDLIDAMALERDLHDFRNDVETPLKVARHIAELSKDETFLKLKHPLGLRARLGNYHHDTSQSEKSLNGIDVTGSPDLEWTLIPASEAPFAAEVVASLDDPDRRPAGFWEDDCSAMLQATVVCRSPTSTHIRMTKTPRLLGPLFQRSVHAASWGFLVSLVFVLLSLAVITDLSPPGLKILIAEILNWTEKLPHGATELWKLNDDEIGTLKTELGKLDNKEFWIFTPITLISAVCLSIASYRVYARRTLLTLTWSAAKGLVLKPKLGRVQSANKNDPRPKLRYSVTFLTQPKTVSHSSSLPEDATQAVAEAAGLHVAEQDSPSVQHEKPETLSTDAPVAEEPPGEDK